jgi:hypothetical protein
MTGLGIIFHHQYKNNIMIDFLQHYCLIKLLIAFAVIGLSVWLGRKTGRRIFTVLICIAIAYILLTWGVMMYFAIFINK